MKTEGKGTKSCYRTDIGGRNKGCKNFKMRNKV